MAVYGKIDEFNTDENQDFNEYLERLEEYFAANDIDNENKIKSIFLTVVGSKTYSLIRSLCAPAKPTDRTYAALKALVKEHVNPKPLIMTFQVS